MKFISILLATEGGIESRKQNVSSETAFENEIDRKIDDNDDFETGPGYMGWKMSDNSQNDTKEKLFLDKLSEVKESYEELKREFVELKVDFENTKKKLDEKKNEKATNDKAMKHLGK